MSAIADLAVRYPQGRVDVQSLHAASGVPVDDILAVTHVAEFPALGKDETAWELTRDAAREVLDRTGVAPERIDVVIYAGSGQWDRPFWSPAAKVAHALGIERAHCFEVGNFCNAAAAALRIAGDRLDAQGSGYALVLVGDRLSRLVDHSDAASVDLFNFGDAAAAVLLTAGAGAFTLAHSALHTDGGWADYYHGEHRGDGVVIRREPHRRGLADAYVENFTMLVDQTLRALGAKLDDVAHLLINHGDRNMHQRLLATLGLPEGKSVFAYDRLGHMGGADTLIALRELVDAGRVRHGDLILLATSAMGFSWGITALECRS
ncbi:3-oxoacyl-[acyl-carrier-protein] synthase III C-terminal domain-containing protein [Streptomyces sp. CBMA152]|uniref:3-oxoacyl-ACP synthase III family protein n=1 Tax=Streptomyces sp. CBMA152 TaxID=1896312 RepID=UPI00166034C2|nr:3-oxoacyl-[acyl-carrier-protein] synthase III C-terminal domain-containing protein [Streptomyces sp. CBMA152]MBD0742391.1 3-oxoacyl-ACP synthase [Streptomyces sp. CBMA152]